MIDRFAALSHMRERIGDPDPDAVSVRKLETYFASALEWLAAELKCKIITTTALYGLVAGEYQYPLPKDCFEILWLKWNNARLTRSYTVGWSRDGVDYARATSGTPTEYQDEAGKTLLLYPPPSAGAIVTAAAMDMSYVAGGLSLNADGVPGFTDLDTWVAVLKAADEYLGIHPDDVNVKRQEANRREWELRLPLSKQYHRQEAPAVTPQAKERVGKAR